MRIFIFVCGEGLGHTSRCIALGQELLSAGHEVYFGAYGYSKELIEKTDYRVYKIPPEIKLVGKAGSLDMKRSIVATLKSGQFLGILKILELLKEIRPNVVISDGYYLGILAAKAKKIPVYAIVNQSNMEVFFKNKGILIKIIGILVKKFFNMILKKADRVIIPDFPMPYTVCRKNLAFTKEMTENVFFSGPLVRKKYGEVKAKSVKKPHVLSTVGGFGYREPIFKKIIKTAKLDDSINYTLMPGPSIEPKKFMNLPDNVKILQFTENPFPYLKSSDVVVAPGGHSTIMEALMFGIPILSFPDMNHSEQENNATVIDTEGYGRRLSYSTSPELILEYIREIVEDKKFTEKTLRLRRLSEELNGPAAIRELLQ